MNAFESLRFFIPEIVLLLGAFGALFLDLVIQNKKAVGAFSLVVLGITFLLSLSFPQTSHPLFYGFFTLDSFTYFFRFAALAIVAITLLISLPYSPLPKQAEGEYYSLFLFMAFALILVAASSNLLSIFLAIEFVSILSYLLVGFLKRDARAKEAAIKYLLFGSLAAGIMLYGMSLLYGISGSLELSVIEKQIAGGRRFYTVALMSFFLFMTGLGFKISMAPFHMWAPDVYEAAPTPVTAFLTVGPKALGFAVLLRVLTSVYSELFWRWTNAILWLSILTMTIGNVVAISQTNIKRLLAYSSIAQAGYILMGVAVLGDFGASAVLIYLLAYAFTNLGAFAVVIAASNHFGNDDLESYAGLSQRSPFLAASLTIFLLSLAGLPPFAGFIGKFFVFSSALKAGYNTLAVAAAINSAVAAFYYFKIVRLMYLVPVRDKSSIGVSLSLSFALFLMLAGTFLMGLLPGPFINFVRGVLLV